MLWILSGSYHSGKNTVRDILAENYGFKIICKSVLEVTAGECFVETDTYGGEELRAKRDPYLVVINNEEDKKFLQEMKEAKEADKIRDVRRKIASNGRIIYDKSLVDYYFIYIEDLRNAVTSNDNYLLVCSNPDVIEQILKVKEVGDGRSNGKVKTIMLFGINLDSKDYSDRTELESALNKSAEKIKDFFRNRSYLQRFDYIIFNRPYENFSERKQNIMSQFELAISNSIDKSSKPIRLFTQKNNDNEIKSSVFFVKPFSGKEEEGKKSRAQIVYDGINQIARQCDRNVHYRYMDNHPKNCYSLGGETPISTVEYDSPDYPQDQMKQQIDNSGLVVVDVADLVDDKFIHKPNCYWELGYARSKNKQILIICDKNAFPLPFDENSIALSYSINGNNVNMEIVTTSMTLRGELQKYFDRLKQAVENRNYHKYLMAKCGR